MIPFHTAHGYRQPSYALTIDGTDITPRLNGRLMSLCLTDSRDGNADQLTLTLSDHDNRTPLPDNGKTLSLALGWAPHLIEKGQFIINEVEITGSPTTVTIRARAVDTTRTLPGQRTISWHQTTLGHIVDTIAARHALTPTVSAHLRAIRIAHIDQTSESDLNFLNRLGQRYDAIASIKSGHLLFIPRGQSTTVSGKPLPAITLSPSDGDHYRYVRTLSDSYSGVRAHYNDRSGSRLRYVIAGNAGAYQNVRELKATYATHADATHAAEAEWARIQRGMSEFHFSLAQGRADIVVESPVRLVGFKETIEKEQWVATEVAHRLDERGYRTEVRCEVGL